jgi:nitroimidazol reductase NimA-like FMN-containing flavoprotein (pyridoxamine 5'-phosphate oxidase superfamily)
VATPEVNDLETRYHVKRLDREIKDKGTMMEVLKTGKNAVIAMCNDNEPYIVTLTYGYDRERHALYFHGATKGQKTDFIAKNPRVCATVIDDAGYIVGQCKYAYTSVVLRGSMHIVEDMDEKRHAIKVLLEHLEPTTPPEGRRPVSDAAYATFHVMRLDIEEMTAKKAIK